MTNEDKYKTAKERTEAFLNYCEPHMMCCDCELYQVRERTTLGRSMCVCTWLELEAEDEKTLPCPFCGDDVKMLKAANHRFLQCQNCNCTYSSGGAFTESQAIAAHNRVAKAVKESEASK